MSEEHPNPPRNYYSKLLEAHEKQSGILEGVKESVEHTGTAIGRNSEAVEKMSVAISKNSDAVRQIYYVPLGVLIFTGAMGGLWQHRLSETNAMVMVFLATSPWLGRHAVALVKAFKTGNTDSIAKDMLVVLFPFVVAAFIHAT